MNSFEISDECEALVARKYRQPIDIELDHHIEFTPADKKAFRAATALFAALGILAGLFVWMAIGDEIASRLMAVIG